MPAEIRVPMIGANNGTRKGRPPVWVLVLMSACRFAVGGIFRQASRRIKVLKGMSFLMNRFPVLGYCFFKRFSVTSHNAFSSVDDASLNSRFKSSDGLLPWETSWALRWSFCRNNRCLNVLELVGKSTLSILTNDIMQHNLLTWWLVVDWRPAIDCYCLNTKATGKGSRSHKMFVLKRWFKGHEGWKSKNTYP